MRVAWFRAPTTGVNADTHAALLRELRQTHIDVIHEAAAHGFVVEHALRPYDVCVFEPRNDPGSDFIWAYLLNYPGVMLLQGSTLHDGRVRELERYRREDDYRREFVFNHGHPPRGRARVFARGEWPMLRAPLLASSLVVVSDGECARALEQAYNGIRVRSVPACAAGPTSVPQAALEPSPLRVAVVGSFRRDELVQTVEHARAAGVPVARIDSPRDAVDPAADVVIALDSPAAASSLTLPLAAMALGKAVIVLEREATAIWPALDPQTWRPRNPRSPGEPPVTVSLDPRDEAHSLMLALKRLAQDGATRRALGVSARAWWLAHATPAHAAAAWRTALEEAAAIGPPPRPTDWPPHLAGDGLGQARATLRDLGVDADPWT